MAWYQWPIHPNDLDDLIGTREEDDWMVVEESPSIAVLVTEKGEKIRMPLTRAHKALRKRKAYREAMAKLLCEKGDDL